MKWQYWTFQGLKVWREDKSIFVLAVPFYPIFFVLVHQYWNEKIWSENKLIFHNWGVETIVLLPVCTVVCFCLIFCLIFWVRLLKEWREDTTVSHVWRDESIALSCLSIHQKHPVVGHSLTSWGCWNKTPLLLLWERGSVRVWTRVFACPYRGFLLRDFRKSASMKRDETIVPSRSSVRQTSFC